MAFIFATSGTRVYIGQPKEEQSAPFVPSDFNDQSWVEIGKTNSIGQFGDQASEITFDLINEGRTKKLKGTRNAGNMELVCAVDADDDGQATVRGAETEPLDYAFRVVFNDAPSGGTPSERLFIAKVMQVREQLDTANNVVRLNATLGINSNIAIVNAAA